MLRDSLRLNAAHLGGRIDDWRDEEPGKRLHQARLGPHLAAGHDPYDAYYGDWATAPGLPRHPRPVPGLDRGPRHRAANCCPPPGAIFDWLDRYGDLDGDGFLEYHCRCRTGRKTRGGRTRTPRSSTSTGRWWTTRSPPASCRPTGTRRCATVRWPSPPAVTARSPADAGRPGRHAAPAVPRGVLDARPGLLRDGARAGQATGPLGHSNDGHLLATGIVPAPYGARRWPAGCWPPTCSAAGASARCPRITPPTTRSATTEAASGRSKRARSRWDWPATAAGPSCTGSPEGMFAAAALFEGYRLPEVLSGLPRDGRYPHPGVYPESCSPQAWSASASIAVVQALLALRPAAPLRTDRRRPAPARVATRPDASRGSRWARHV